MSFAAKTMSKPISMATNGCLISGPSSTSRVSYAHPFLSIPYKTTIKFQLSCKNISSLSLPSTFSSKRVNPFFRVSVVAAAQEENNPVILEEKEEEREIEGDLNWDVSENDETDADGEETFAEPPEGAKLYVGNLPYEMDSEKLAELFQQAGVVDIAEVIYDRQTDRSRGFGFVTMSSVEEAERGVEMFNRYDVNGRLLTVNIAAPRGSRPERPPQSQAVENSCKLYVGNLAWSVDGDRLGEVFSQYGEVVSAQVISDRETGRSRGFGFVVMSNESESNDAIANLDGEMLDGRAIRVNVAQERPRRGSF